MPRDKKRYNYQRREEAGGLNVIETWTDADGHEHFEVTSSIWGDPEDDPEEKPVQCVYCRNPAWPDCESACPLED